jgi:outer membrane receptor protein involved in Fe transport
MTKLPLTLKGMLLASSALLGVSFVAGSIAPALAGETVEQPNAAQAPASAVPLLSDAPEQIIVRGMFIPDTVRETAQVSTVLVPEDLLRQGDDSAAEALVRLSGLSVVGGRFVYVRGLGERYSSALLNGSPLPSPEPLQRVVPLDLFPSNILAGATVQKSYSAQFPGEFGGGIINLETLGVPEERFLTAGLSTGGNTKTTLRQGNTYYGSSSDWTGFDDGTRKMPRELSDAIASGRGRISEGNNFTPAEIQSIGRSFVNAPLNLMQRGEIPANFALNMSGGDRWDLGWGDVGVVGVAGYDNSWTTRQGVQEEGVLTVAGDISPDTHYDFDLTRNDIVVNGLLGLGLNWGENMLRWTNLFVRSVTKTARSRAGFDQLAGADVRDDNTDWFERELLNTQVTGSTSLGNLGIAGRAAYAESRRESPYEKGIRYRLVNGEYLHNASQEQNFTRFGEVNDRVKSAAVDFTYSLPLAAEREAIFSAGYSYMDNARSAQQREFRFLATNSSLPIGIQRERVDFLLSDFNIRPDRLVLRETSGSDGAAAYDAGLTVQGVYAQADAEILPFVRLALGARYEDATQHVSLVDLFGGAPPLSPAERSKGYVLPTASLTWNFFEDMQLRVSSSMTIARPQFRELAPQPYYDPDSDRLYIGNPFLVDSKLINGDVRYEYYFGTNQFLALGGFYKDIDKPVELIVNEVGATQQTTFINAPKARLYGVELEGRRYFMAPLEGYLGRLVWFAGGNYTFSKSEVKVGAGDVVFPFAGNGVSAPANIYVQDGDRLQGQSEHLANLQFGFDDEAMGLQTTLLLNYASERISTRGRPGFPDLMVQPGVTLDLTLRKTWIDAGGVETELGFEARNLLNENFDEFQKLGAGTVVNQRYDLGQSFSIGIRRRY